MVAQEFEAILVSQLRSPDVLVASEHMSWQMLGKGPQNVGGTNQGWKTTHVYLESLVMFEFGLCGVPGQESSCVWKCVDDIFLMKTFEVWKVMELFFFFFGAIHFFSLGLLYPNAAKTFRYKLGLTPALVDYWMF